MTGAERGLLLLGSHLGSPERKPLTPAQLRKLARRARQMDRQDPDRDLSPADLIPLGYGREEAERILALLSDEALLERYLQKAARLGCVPLTWRTPGYPEKLRAALADDAPACLWARGDLTNLSRPAVSLVGSRDLSPANREFARAAGLEAARQGFCLVSGNARGADQTAQNAALAAEGQVISILADRLSDHAPVPGVLYLSEDSFDLDFSAPRALSRNRCIHALGRVTLAAQCSLRTGGTWDGSVKNLRFGWSPLCVFDDGSESAELLRQMGAELISPEELSDLSSLPRGAQLTF